MSIQRNQVIVALIGVAVVIALTLVAYNYLTLPYPGLNDFMSRWEGARSFWIDGLNPYGDEASLNIQKRIYGRPAAPDEDPGYFAYPFYTVFVIWPLVYLDYAWASAVWLVLLAICQIAALVMILQILRWRPSVLTLGLLALWSLLSYYPARGLILGQPGLLVYFLEILALFTLAKQRDSVAGAVLALSTIKPQMGYLLIPFLILWGLWSKRWRFVGMFLATFLGLMLGSFLLNPTWLGDWLGQVRIYSDYTALGSPVWIITHYYLGISDAITYLIEAFFYGLMLWGWFNILILRRQERFLWVIVLTLTVTHLVAPRTATPHFVVFMIPIVFYLRELADRRGNRAVILILVVLFAGQWAHFLLTVSGRFEHPTVYLPLPFTMLILLWLDRARWWARPNLYASL